VDGVDVAPTAPLSLSLSPFLTIFLIPLLREVLFALNGVPV